MSFRITAANAGIVKGIKPRIGRVPVALAIGLLILLAMVGSSLWLSRTIAANNIEAAGISEYRRAITDISSALRDAEIGQRGFLLTNKIAYLDPYRKASDTIAPAVTRMGQFGGQRGKVAVERLQPLVQAKFDELAETIRLNEQEHHDAALAIVGSDRGKRLMDQMRTIFERERSWAIRQTDAISARSAQAITWLTLGLIAGMAAIVFLTILVLRQTRAQLAALADARSDAEIALEAMQQESAAREESEGRVRQLQKMQAVGQLTGGIAHDFNNMLAVVMSGIELAKRRVRSDPVEAETFLDASLDSAHKAAKLTSRLLAFSRNQPLAPQPVDLNRLLGGMADMLARALGEAIAVETVRGAGLWRCYADASEIENAMLNLAVNARDAMPDGGKLTIETCNVHVDDRYAAEREIAVGQYVQICLTDTGEGMAPEVVERAFEPFFTTKEVGKGTGLGLSQVFGFARQSGGHVSIYSEVGEGTTVKLYLPRFFGAEIAVAETLDTTGLATGSKDELILVVEDEARVRDFAVAILKELNYTTLLAETPGEALELIASRDDISLLFTDVVMPEMNGRRLAELAREISPDLKVLFTTGYSRNAVVHNGTIDVGVAFLAKPYSIQDVARKIRDVLDGGGINRPI